MGKSRGCSSIIRSMMLRVTLYLELFELQGLVPTGLLLLVDNVGQ